MRELRAGRARSRRSCSHNAQPLAGTKKYIRRRAMRGIEEELVTDVTFRGGDEELVDDVVFHDGNE